MLHEAPQQEREKAWVVDVVVVLDDVDDGDISLIVLFISSTVVSGNYLLI